MVKIGLLLVFGFNIALISAFRISLQVDADVNELNGVFNQIAESVEPLDTSSMLYVNPGVTKGQCSCTGSQCGCCVLLKIPVLNGSVCANISYEADIQSFITTITIKNAVIFKAQFSGKNPKPVCLSFPYTSFMARMCIQLYNVEMRDNQVGACLKFQLKFILFEQAFELGCFHVPLPHNGREQLVGWFERSKEDTEVNQPTGNWKQKLDFMRILKDPE